MSIKETPISSDSRAASKHRTYITILETYVAILGTILGLVFTWSQLRFLKMKTIDLAVQSHFPIL